MSDDKITITIDGVTHEVSRGCVVFTPTVEHLAEIGRKIAAELDAMSPEARAELQTTERFQQQKEDEEHLAALTPTERQRVLDMREQFHDRLRAPKPIKLLSHETFFDFLKGGVQQEAVGAEAALRTARGRNYRRPKPRADGC
jgi:hypothetical protein